MSGGVSWDDRYDIGGWDEEYLFTQRRITPYNTWSFRCGRCLSGSREPFEERDSFGRRVCPSCKRWDAEWVRAEHQARQDAEHRRAKR